MLAAPPVAIVMGSQSDWPTMRNAAEMLDNLKIDYEARIVSAHTVATGEQVELRTPFHGRPLVAQVTSCYRGSDNRWHVGFKLVDPPRWSG